MSDLRRIATINIGTNTFYGNTNIVNVDCNYTPWQNNSMHSAFMGCHNLKSVNNINNNVNNMTYTFYNCYNLTNVQSIPNSVQNMAGTFNGCTNLINTPVIPDSVKDVMYLFNGCTNLINGTSIPNNNITSLANTFRNCINLTGDIYIYSEKISDLTLAFAGTSNIKNVYIPFNNAGINTITYNTFISAGYTSTGTKEGVYLKDLNESPTPPTPSDEIDVTNYTYIQDENGVVTLTDAPIDENGEVIFPNIEEQ